MLNLKLFRVLYHLYIMKIVSIINFILYNYNIYLVQIFLKLVHCPLNDLLIKIYLLNNLNEVIFLIFMFFDNTLMFFCFLNILNLLYNDSLRNLLWLYHLHLKGLSLLVLILLNKIVGNILLLWLVYALLYILF